MYRGGEGEGGGRKGGREEGFVGVLEGRREEGGGGMERVLGRGEGVS